MHSNRASMRRRAARGALSFRTTGVSPARPHVHSFDGAGQERVNHVCCEYQLVVLPRGLLPYATFRPATPCLFAPELRSRSRVTGHMPLVQLHGLRQAQAWPDLRPDPARRRGVPLSEQLLSGCYLPHLESTSAEDTATSRPTSRLALARVLRAFELCQGAVDSWHQSLVSLGWATWHARVR